MLEMLESYTQVNRYLILMLITYNLLMKRLFCNEVFQQQPLYYFRVIYQSIPSIEHLFFLFPQTFLLINLISLILPTPRTIIHLEIYLT